MPVPTSAYTLPISPLIRAERPLKPFPPIPWELKAAIIRAGADGVSISPFHQTGDEHEDSVRVYTFLKTCLVVNKDFASVAIPLLYAHVSLTTVPNGKRFLRTISNPSSFSSTVVPGPLRSFIRTFTWATWEPSNLPQDFNYKAIISIRLRLLSILLKEGAVRRVEFPTVVWPLLKEFEEIESEELGRLRSLGMILAVENRSLSEVLTYPIFKNLRELSIWYGDPATGIVEFPPTLESLKIRCDHFNQGNNIPLRELSIVERQSNMTHMPQLRKLDFSFTTKRYPEASPWGPEPTFLSAIGSTINHLSLSTDRSSCPQDSLLDLSVFGLCPNLQTLELTNHRVFSSGLDDGRELFKLGHRRLSRIHYRLDGETPCGEPEAVGPSSQMDLLALGEIKSLFERGRARFPKLEWLSIGMIPKDQWSDSLSTMLGSLTMIPGVKVTDEWDRPVWEIIDQRNRSEEQFRTRTRTRSMAALEEMERTVAIGGRDGGQGGCFPAGKKETVRLTVCSSIDRSSSSPSPGSSSEEDSPSTAVEESFGVQQGYTSSSGSFFVGHGNAQGKTLVEEGILVGGHAGL
ncbi:hypothetical protein [Phaffia rhodozyma]|uniref:Uncharacterized protein n=1 Tax=Phaffia rhodozyma TaxID=264483 RepID=A0A0F7SFM1_PHARH|nr:hypothetical protein [Phaffia rhodozyma]